MKLDPIHEFIMNTDKPELKEYLEALRNKIDGLNAKTEKTSILMLLTAFTYFLIRNALVSNINLGFIEMNKADIGIIAIPPIFSFLVFYWYTLAVHKERIIKTSKVISTFLLKGKLKPFNDDDFCEVVRLYLPFSFWEELFVGISGNKTAGRISLLLIIPPLICLIFSPFGLIYYMIEVLLKNYPVRNFIVILSVFLTGWFGVITIGFFITRFMPLSKIGES